MTTSAPKDFLLEIGCEELPADYLPDILHEDPAYQGRGLGMATHLALEKQKVAWKQITVYGAPRRLVLLVSGVEPQVRYEEEGPPVQVAFDKKGAPTAAALGFAKKQGVAVSSLKRKKSARGERLVLERVIPTTQALAKTIPMILQWIQLPKAMRWESSGVRFVRPIRWLLALYGTQQIPCAFADIKSGKTSFVPDRFTGRAISVGSASGYLSTIRQQKVQLETGATLEASEGLPKVIPSVRPKEKALLARLRAAAKKAGGHLPDEKTEEFQWLLSTLTFLAEDPHVQIGSFRKEYLALPSEVLATAMAKHLKLMSVISPSGKLLPKFLAVLEGKPSTPARVISNYEKVLEARFADAQFFYREDSRSKLADRVSVLDQVVFHKKLGSVGERIPRLIRLSEQIAQQVKLSSEITAQIRKAAELAKADLTTQMVREFPSLQGVIGGLYAQEAGEAGAVAAGIAEHYAPRTASDAMPSTPVGVVISLADRIDTLLGFFGAGLIPTGSLDPYALRRQALGVVRILTESKSPTFVGLSIDRLLDEGIQSWGSKIHPPQDVKRQLHAFLQERFEWLASARDRVERPLIRCVLSSSSDDLADAWERLAILRQLWTHPAKRTHLIKAAKVAERTSRIVRSQKEAEGLGAADPGKLKDAAEKELWSLWEQVSPQLKTQIQDRRYEEGTRVYATLYPALHTFFDSVMVMDEDPALRRNRLSLMNEIHQALAGRFADLSELPLSGIEITE